MFLDEPFNDFVAIGGVSHFSFMTQHVDRVLENAVRWHVKCLPHVTKHSRYHILAALLHQHGEQQTNVIAHDRAVLADRTTHGT